MTRCYSVKDNGGEDDDDSRVDELVPGFDQSLCKQIFQDIIKTCIRIFVFVYLYSCIFICTFVPEWPLVGDCHGVSNCASEASHP